jgi:23S rRNA G2445 N2-methylase RlmL
MPYRYVTVKQDYSDYARGRVLFGQHGHPAYPVRLASEVWQRCVALLRKHGRPGPYVLYDPCCGGAYLLTAVGLLHRSQLRAVIGSDVDAGVLETARHNLALLSVAGMARRLREIRGLYETYGKPSHAAAIESALRLREQLAAAGGKKVEVQVFEADATDARALARGLRGRAIDALIADLPYGRDSKWKRLQEDSPSSCSPLYQMLEALRFVTSADTIVALSCDKGPKLVHPAYQRVERFRLGKRQVAFMRLLAHSARTPRRRD